MGWSTVSVWLLSGGVTLFSLWQFLKHFYPWLPKDLAYLRKLAGVVKQLQKWKKAKTGVADILEEKAKLQPDKKLVLFEDEEWTYQQMNQWANQCSRALKSVGICRGDKIGLMMMNEPAFLALWIGSIRLGSITAFLNFNLKRKSLLHCIDTAEIKCLIIGKDTLIVEAIKQIESDLEERNIEVFVYGSEVKEFKSLSNIVENQTSNSLPLKWKEGASYNDTLCYIYTSGTTGFPKAVNVDYNKSNSGMMVFSFCSPTEHDVVYTSLPLYHSAGSLIGFCGTVFAGCTIVLRKKFSAGQFWTDCRKFNVTIIQYIGETMRYICNQPATINDRNHSVTKAIGNGLRPDVWREFLNRFGSDIHIAEFYAATEGNIGFFNYHNDFGCIGTFSPLMRLLSNGRLVKFNVETEEIVRDANGHAILVGCNEPGLLIGEITSVFQMSKYKGKKSLSDKKILCDVFKTGDKYFNTGDLLMFDEMHRISFVDRVGDTFRWKGENVSTNEVSDMILQASGIKEANTYGVEIPGTNGRAGMVAIVLDEDDSFNEQAFYNHVIDVLPSYAQPIFVRILPELEVTGTFKQRKVTLVKEGFDLDMIKDKLLVQDNKSKCYVPLTKKIANEIISGSFRV